MTTVAADRESMAADTQASDATKSAVRKLFGHQGWILGFAGAASSGARLVGFLKASRKDPLERLEEYRAKYGERDDVELLLLSPEGRLWTYDGNYYELTAPFAAIGSGAMAAEALLHEGYPPKYAVEVAAKLDPYTGGRVHMRWLGNARRPLREKR